MTFMRIGAFSASNIAVLLAAMVSIGCAPQQPAQVSQAPASSTADLMKQRGLSEADVSAALQTYMPTGQKDTYLTFASGGHGGNMVVIGVPSMRVLKYVGVFTPEPWQAMATATSPGRSWQVAAALAGRSRGAICTTRRSPRPTVSTMASTSS